MSELTVEQRLTNIEESLLGIAFTLQSLSRLQPPGPTSEIDKPVPLAPPAVPRRVYQYREDGILADGRKEPVSGARIDPVVDADCPTAVAVPDPLEPGSTLYVSKARTDLNERWLGYVIRVSDQCKGGLTRLGSAGYLATQSFAPFGGFKADGSNWPQAAAQFHRRKPADATAPGWISGQPLPGTAPAPAPGPTEVKID